NYVSIRQPAPTLLDNGALVPWIAVRVQQANRHRFGVDGRQGAEIERLELPLGTHAPADAVRALERNERLGPRLTRAVELRAGLPAQVQEMLEAGGGDERGPRSLALEQRIGRCSRPVCESLDAFGARRPRCCEDRLLLVR